MTSRTTAHRSRSGMLLLVAFVVVWAAWAAIFLSGEDFQAALRVISVRATTITTGSASITVVLIGLSLMAVASGVVLFVRFRTWFWGVLISGFALSEMQIGLLNDVGFLVRYTFMCVLIALGVVALLSRDRGPGKTARTLGLFYLVWLLLTLAIHGVGGATAAMLPMQFALMLGVLYGLMQEYRAQVDAKWLCLLIGKVGVAFTVLHLTSLAFAPEPFLAGRFRSYFVLPTNFANRYALLVIAMIWAALISRAGFGRAVFWGSVALGGVLLVLSGTRNAIAMVVVALCIMALVWRVRLAALAAGVALVAVVGVTVFVEDLSQLVFSADRITTFDASNRYAVWALALERIGEHPYVGYGLGRAGSIMQEGIEWYSKGTFIDAHNAYMGIWLQLGLPGLILILLLYLNAFKLGFGLLLRRSTSTDGELVRVVALPLAILGALFVGGIFEENLTSRGSLPQLLWGLSILVVSSLVDPVGRSAGSLKGRMGYA